MDLEDIVTIIKDIFVCIGMLLCCIYLFIIYFILALIVIGLPLFVILFLLIGEYATIPAFLITLTIYLVMWYYCWNE